MTLTLGIVLAAVAVAALMSLFFSSLTYSLRDFSRAKLEAALERREASDYLDPTATHASDLIFVTAVGRLFANILVVIGVLRLVSDTHWSMGAQYLLTALLAALIHVFFSVAVPHAISRHAGEATIATFIRFLHGLRLAMLPVTKLMHGIDAVVAKAATSSNDQSTEPQRIEEEIENEILSAVEEGEKEGVLDEDERRMIESVINFHDTVVGQVMTPRPEIFAIEVGASLETVKQKVAESGHSRIPVYREKVDQIVGVLYVRDLLKFLGQSAERFNIKDYVRPPFFVPETKPLPDLLQDFRLQKVHIAIVSDEYGGVAGLITIEDLVEELVGDLSDEHEPSEPAMLDRQSELTAEADARIYIDELNRVLGLNLPEEEGYDTLGGFVVNTLGRIPQSGTTFEHAGVKFTVLDAEPQKVNRVRIDLAPQPAVAEEPSSASG